MTTTHRQYTLISFMERQVRKIITDEEMEILKVRLSERGLDIGIATIREEVMKIVAEREVDIAPNEWVGAA